MSSKNTKLNTYLDESGNTGKNLIDLKQPFLTLGSVLIDDSKIEAFTDFLKALPEDLKEFGEIKGNNIACYDQSLAIEILSDVLPKYADMFLFNVIEKKFMIAGQVVENFFDYAYNDNTNVRWSYKSDVKINLANFFYENLSATTIENVHKAFTSCNVQHITSSFLEISEEIRDINYDFDVVQLLSGAEKHLNSLAVALSHSSSKNAIERGVPKHTITTPNVSAFFELIGRIEKYLDHINTSSILFFDSSDQYNKVFESILKLRTKSQRVKVPISETEYIQFGFQKLIGYQIKESKNSIGLQVADILSSIINHVFTKIIRKENENLTKEDILLTGLVFIFSFNQPLGYLTVANSTHSRIYEIFQKFEGEN